MKLLEHQILGNLNLLRLLRQQWILGARGVEKRAKNG